MDTYASRRFHTYRSRSKSPVNAGYRNYGHDSRHNEYGSDDCRSSPKWKHGRDNFNDRTKFDRSERNVYNASEQVFNRNSCDKRESSLDSGNRGRFGEHRGVSREGIRSRSREHSVEKMRDHEMKQSVKQRDNVSDDYNFKDRNVTEFNDFNRHQVRYDRRRERDKDRGRSRSRERAKSRSRSRERNKSRSRSRDRDRNRRHSRDRERDRRDGRRDEDRDKRHYNDDEATINILERQNVTEYKNQTPNKTIMIRGLVKHITEDDIRQDLVMCGFIPKEIRHVRNRRTGSSRGFAFVEFPTLEESIQWMEMKQGSLMLQNKYRGALVYSIPKDAACALLDKSSKTKAGWHCVKCATHNFRRRSSCYGCSASRVESEDGGCGNDEVSQYATKTIMLRNLDALSTEDSVMGVLKTVVQDMIKFINGVLIGRDPLTQTSRGICYLDMETTVEALSLHGALTALDPPLKIDGKQVTISYCKYRMGDLNEIFPQVAFGSAATAQTYTMSDLNALADYSASRYAKTPAQYQHYYEYYKNYFAQQISQGQAISLAQESQANSVNAAAAVAHSAMLQRQRKMAVHKGTFRMPNGTDNKKYPIPEVSSYIYDESTGYYYDSTTGLYYDANSQYYYNSVIQKYLYWDGTHSTYILAPTQSSSVLTAATTVTSVPATGVAIQPTEEKDKKKNKLEKPDKAKVAKKIAKDMERWAKTMSKNKEAARGSMSNDMGGHATANQTIGSADIGFAVLEKKAAMTANSTLLNMGGKGLDNNEFNSANHASNNNLVAAYGGGSDTSGDEDSSAGLVEGLDWENLVCMLCKRKFNSKEGLAKHQKVSELHKTNLEQYCLQHGIDKDKGQTVKYRDRAKERREKFGESDDPIPSKLKEKYLKAREAAEPVAVSQPQNPIGSDNVGNKLLQKMGWSEGQGLGKSNQGRTSIIQAERLVSNVGLGAKSNAYTALPGESYKDVVKKMMYARYQEINDR